MESVDAAILRENRFDLKLEIESIKDKKDAIKMCMSFGMDKQQTYELVDGLNIPINQSKLQVNILNKIKE